MITHADVEKLLGVCSAGPSVLSLYVRVPTDPPALRELPAHADDLIASAGDRAADSDVLEEQRADRHIVRRMLEIHARDWLGHTVAIFACDEPRLAEMFVLPGAFEDRAVFAARPHVRPLLLALQRHPVYCAVVVDQQHAWVFRVAGEQIDKMTLPAAGGVRSAGYGGWYGLESRRVSERVFQLAHHHYRDAAAALGPLVRRGGPVPLVVGGHGHEIPQFLAELPEDVRAQVVGCFPADPHTMTPSRVRQLADHVMTGQAAARERSLITQVLQEPRGGLTATGLQPCLDAVSQRAVKLLVVPENGLVPGFACQRCCTLSSTGDDCPDWGAASVAVPDLIEEMAVTALADGAEVQAVPDPPGGVAARLRFPLAAWGAQSA